MLTIFLITFMIAGSFLLDYCSIVYLSYDAAIWALLLAAGAIAIFLFNLVTYKLDCKRLVGTRK